MKIQPPVHSNTKCWSKSIGNSWAPEVSLLIRWCLQNSTSPLQRGVELLSRGSIPGTFLKSYIHSTRTSVFPSQLILAHLQELEKWTPNKKGEVTLWVQCPTSVPPDSHTSLAPTLELLVQKELAAWGSEHFHGQWCGWPGLQPNLKFLLFFLCLSWKCLLRETCSLQKNPGHNNRQNPVRATSGCRPPPHPKWLQQFPLTLWHCSCYLHSCTSNFFLLCIYCLLVCCFLFFFLIHILGFSPFRF